MQTEQIKVSGMSCGGCITNVTHALKVMDGVKSVNISLPTGEVAVEYDEELTTLSKLKSAVIRAGYGVNEINATHGLESKGGCGC